MKMIMLSLMVLAAGCSSWDQRDFEKELEKTAQENGQDPKVTVTTKQDERILEKFEVQSINEKKVEKSVPKKPAPVVKKAVRKKVVPTSVNTVAEKEKEKSIEPEIVPKVKPLPEDYPPELLTINAKAKKVWDVYKPNHYVDQKFYLDINYLGMTVGKIMVMNKGKKLINDKEVWHFYAKFKSAPFYSNIYELDDTVDTYVTTDEFLSTRYSLIQRETKQDVDDLQLHDRDQLKTFSFYHRKKSDGNVKDKKDEKYIPYYSIDPFSVVFFYQGLPLKNNDVYEIPLINKGKILILRSMVEGREKISTKKGTRNAIRLHATTKYTGETLKSGDLYFWFSDDDERTLLKAQAKIKIGSVTADIVDTE